jgi:hypothetical protein
MDDDTWLNMPAVLKTVTDLYPYRDPYIVAGCLIRSRVQDHNMTFPFGGWGTTLTKTAIERLLTPIYCKNANTAINEFQRLSCRQISQNSIGEGPLFRDGMSIVELMHAYTTHQRYLDVSTWSGVGYCLHSDWMLGYFTNLFPRSLSIANEVFSTRMRAFNGSSL